MRIAVLGNGGFGSAMATAVSRMGHAVSVYGHDAGYTQQIAATRRNPRYLPEDIELPAEIGWTSDGAQAVADAECLLFAVPTQHLRQTLLGFADAVPAQAPLVSLAKGIEQASGRRPTQVLAEVLPGSRVLALSGPSHAEEVARGLPAAVVLAGGDAELRRRLQHELSDPRLRIYRNDDLLGVELCGALKNVMALAAGIAEGLGLGDNAKAAILSRGLVEMVRFGEAEGAHADTFWGLAGVGDLAVTAFSRHGRNRAFGERIGRGERLDEILATTRKVAEGVWTSRVVVARARELGIDMPLAEAVGRVLFDGLPADRAVGELMEREHKREMA